MFGCRPLSFRLYCSHTCSIAVTFFFSRVFDPLLSISASRMSWHIGIFLRMGRLLSIRSTFSASGSVATLDSALGFSGVLIIFLDGAVRRGDTITIICIFRFGSAVQKYFHRRLSRIGTVISGILALGW